MTANRTASSICAKCRPVSRTESALRPSLRVYLQTCVHFRTGVWTLRTLRIRHRAHGASAAYCRRRFAQRSGLSRSTAPNVLLILVGFTTRVPQRPAAGPSRRPGPTGRYRHRAHGTPAAHCRRRFAQRSGHSRSTVPDVLLRVAASPLEYPTWASCRTVPSAQADGPTPASGPRHARGPLPSPIRPSKRPLPIHSTQCATYVVPTPVMALYQCRSS